MDTMTAQQRHANMAAIHGKDTKPEMAVRRYLWRHGFRYRLNYRRLPGKPDIVMRKYRTCIFVNGCFWHGHNVDFEANMGIENSNCCKIPKTNRDFWVKKIVRNQQRDIEVQHKLALLGWHSITIWECQLKPAQREHTLEALAYTLNRIFIADNGIKLNMPDEEPLARPKKVLMPPAPKQYASAQTEGQAMAAEDETEYIQTNSTE